MQAVGSQSYLAIAPETTWGVAPTNPALQKLTAAVYGESLGATYEEVVSNTITGARAKADIRNGNKTVSGKVPFELSILGLSVLLAHAVGSPTTTGTGPYTHVYKRGALPTGLTVVKWFADIAKGYQFTGCRVNSVSLSVGSQGAVTGDIELIGKDAQPLTAPYGTLATDTAHSQILQSDATVTIDGVSAALVSLTLNLTNGLDAQRAIGSRLAASLREGVGEVSGTLTMFFQDVNALADMAAETSHDVRISFATPAGSLEFRIPAARFTGDPVAKIASDKGLTIALNFKSKLDPVTGSDIVVTLVNAQETI